MALIFRPSSKSAAMTRPHAKRLAAALRGRKGVRSQVVDGFIMQATSDGKNVVVRVVEAPAILGLYVGGATTMSTYYPNTYNLFDPMLDAVVQMPIGTSDLCYPAEDFAPILIEPNFRNVAGSAISRMSGTQRGIVTIEGRGFVYGNWDDINYQPGPAWIYRAFPTPNALLSVAVKYKYQNYNNPFREPAIGISRLCIGSGKPGSGSYGPATASDHDYFEIDVYGLGIETLDAAQVIGVLEWGEHDGLVLVSFGAYQHLIRYSMTINEGTGKPVGHILWRHRLDSYKYLSGPFSAGIGDAVGDKSSVFFAERTENDGVMRTIISSMFKVSATGVIAEVELNRYTYNTTDSGVPAVGLNEPNIHVGSALTPPQTDETGAIVGPGELRFLAINFNGLGQLSSIPSITPFFRLVIHDPAGGKIAVSLPGMLPVNHWLGIYAPYSGGFTTNANRQRTTICQYAPGYAAVLVMPQLNYHPTFSDAIDLRMAVVNVTTGEVVGVSPVLTTHSVMDGLCLAAVEQGVVEEGVIVKHAKLLLSKVKIEGRIYPFFKPLYPSEIFMVHGLSGATKIATCKHPAHAYYLGTALKPAKIGISTGMRDLLRNESAPPPPP